MVGLGVTRVLVVVAGMGPTVLMVWLLVRTAPMVVPVETAVMPVWVVMVVMPAKAGCCLW